jgi:hypothetical protein
VPTRNYVGWVLTTLSVYPCSGIAFRVLSGRPETARAAALSGASRLAYGLVAADHVFSNAAPELRVVDVFGISLIALIALLRLSAMPRPVLDWRGLA